MMSLEHNEVVDGVREWLLPHSARKMNDSNVLEEFMPAKDFGETRNVCRSHAQEKRHLYTILTVLPLCENRIPDQMVEHDNNIFWPRRAFKFTVALASPAKPLDKSIWKILLVMWGLRYCIS